MKAINKKINFKDIVTLSGILEEKGLYFKARRKDDYTAYLEPMGICACDGRLEEAADEVKKYFNDKNVKVDFNFEGLEFRIV
jgi:hypothetical protein